MKPRFLFSILTVSILCSGSLVAQDKSDKSAKPAAPPDMAEMMKKWAAFATPAGGHKTLEPMVGEWDLASKVWMVPGTPPTESKGTASTKWILGGRYLQTDVTSEMMGMPMTGLSFTGYDNFRKKYGNFWIDNLGTGMYLAEGTADASGKIFTYTLKMDDPMTGEKDKPFKYIHKFESADRHVFEMHDLTMTANSKMMEMVYTRKK